MGVTATDISLLLELRLPNAKAARVVTIGRLSMYLHPHQLRKLRRLFPHSEAVRSYRWGDPAEGILALITGASEIVSLDYSNYEGATIIHDLNLPIDISHPQLVGAFDLVIDGGTLEHIFNFPAAAANLMSLCCNGGYVLMINPANNLCGHGFYQFSPELMHRLFSRQNGFEIDTVLLTICKALSIEREMRPRSYKVVDPKDLGHRVIIQNRYPAVLRTLARKTTQQPLNPAHVQQSDYTMVWTKETAEYSNTKRVRRIIFNILQRLPYRLQTIVFDWLYGTRLRHGRAMTAWRDTLG